MKTIWKYTLLVTDIQHVGMPAGAIILTVQTQNETPHLWALVDPKQDHVITRTIGMYGTGDGFDAATDHEYIGTFQLRGGQVVKHVFEI